MGTRLLVVDPDASACDSVRAAAGRMDCEIVAVSTAEAALEHIRGPQPIDLVVAAQGVDGARALAALAETRPSCPSIVTTTAATVDGAVDALRAGAIDYLVKPIAQDVLAAAIAAGLAKHRLLTRLRKAQRLETVGEIVGGVAHDFNNLLVVITNFAELITEMCYDDANSPVAEAADCITQAGKSAAVLTRQLLELSRHKAPSAEPVDVYELIRGTEKMLRSAMGSHNKLEIAPIAFDTLVMADRGHLEHVLLNLAVHARDTMPSGSTLAVDGRRAGDTVAITVTTSRTTISDAAHERLFEPFYATRESMAGSGFGRAEARDLIEAVGGTLTASPSDGGTQFLVQLPAADRDEQDADDE